MSGPKPGANRTMVTICAMSATIMQALDTTIANVALPYMQGSLSASLDQINWVLTSYIVAAAIMTAPIGWIAERFGRKRLFIICVAGFTFASGLCGFAQSIEQMVLFRLLQGAFGAALVPLSQAVLLDSYDAQERGSAMAIWGVGVMLGPIMGPTLGAWLTDNYNWRWVFFINLPMGVITVLGLLFFMRETPLDHSRRFDWFGFAALALGIGALQVMLDRGEQQGWFESHEIVTEAAISATGFYFFFAHSLTTSNPFVRFELFRDRNFIAGSLFMLVIGVVLFATMALVTPYMQNVVGYPILTAGFLLASRGAGTLVAMLIVGRLLKIIEARYLVFAGLSLSALTLHQMSLFTEQTSSAVIVATSVLQGFGLGLVFVPLNTAAFATLPAVLRTEGTAMLTLLRNIGSSVGISLVIARLTEGTIEAHARLVEFVTPFNSALSASPLDAATDKGRAMLENLVSQQAAIIAYGDDFKFLMVLVVASLPLVAIIGASRVGAQAEVAFE
ncbi:DHA2 family efflux MFS transporter permease subunit [Methylocystis sp. MJC1]|uniref:DHA2 family efflux MFS transporter permease subunit n=1 Tax=Methylocystis sp. MJC1 TaxID=2654282 RepID=UPI0013EAB1E8|nr:DHA2 family efflux MFS transporter permease subunit [Methylocystis sp. MJC1]KAF2991227.1 Multidrug export protein EmrB [Methylocystis sp. MJC1]MBU6526233.1 DHA2 family efflux MFS transporter permease subunit [Methylocystis sp. MJC1]UZX12687.1 DHA2 family efflux MFS transporter permease subunit [Methylocystis sp. MJC1]